MGLQAEHIQAPTNGTVKESKVDVLVIGAGPAGLMASNALQRAGVSVRVVDKRGAVL